MPFKNTWSRNCLSGYNLVSGFVHIELLGIVLMQKNMQLILAISAKANGIAKGNSERKLVDRVSDSKSRVSGNKVLIYNILEKVAVLRPNDEGS